MNHVPKSVLQGITGFDDELVDHILSVREGIGGFDPRDNVEVTAEARSSKTRPRDFVSDMVAFRPSPNETRPDPTGEPAPGAVTEPAMRDPHRPPR